MRHRAGRRGQLSGEQPGLAPSARLETGALRSNLFAIGSRARKQCLRRSPEWAMLRLNCMPTNAIHLHGMPRATPEKAYRAFLDIEAVAPRQGYHESPLKTTR